MLGLQGLQTNRDLGPLVHRNRLDLHSQLTLLLYALIFTLHMEVTYDTRFDLHFRIPQIRLDQ
jgi:hypothetical protein